METTFFYHGRGHNDENVRNTIAGRFEGGKLVLSLSLCSNKDVFCKKTGRSIAVSRLNHADKGRGVREFTVEDTSRKTFINTCHRIDELPREEKLRMFGFPEYLGK